jgi:hypothetical protein
VETRYSHPAFLCCYRFSVGENLNTIAIRNVARYASYRHFYSERLWATK